MQVVLAEPSGFCAGVVRAIEIVERALAKRGPPVHVRHEIVHDRHVGRAFTSRYATQNRQAALRELARRVEVILVVGAHKRSNSNRLVDIARECGVSAHLLADGNDLDPEWVAGAKSVGLTAGASTAEAQVQHVIAALRRPGPVELTTLPGVAENVEFRLPTALVGDNASLSFS